jgi:hypothetical protein
LQLPSVSAFELFDRIKPVRAAYCAEHSSAKELTVITYFHLAPPEDESLLAQPMVPSTIDSNLCTGTGKPHLDRYRRTSDLVLETGSQNSEKRMIWTFSHGCWVCLVHDSLLAKMRDAGITGFRTRSTMIYSPGQGGMSDYQELVICGWGGVAQPQSGVRVIRECPKCQWKRYSGVRDVDQLIDWNQWSGDDFFYVWPLRHILITERVAEVLLGLKVEDFDLKGLECDWSDTTVGLLSDLLPDDVAQKYGLPLGLE